MESTFNDLSTFNWEANPNETDFFGIKAEQYQEQVEKDKPVESSEEDVEKDKDSTDTETIDENPFTNFTTVEESEEVDKPEKGKPGRPKNEEPTNYLDQYNSFKNYGLFKNVELEEEVEDLDEDTFKDLLEQDYEEEVNARIQQWATQELDEEAQAFIKFKKNGGRTEDFIKTLSSNTIDLNGDIEDEDFQNNIIRNQLKAEGWDREEIEDRLEYLSKIDKKQTTAEKYFGKLKEKADKEARKLVEKQEAFKKQQEQAKLDFKNAVKETLSTTQEVKGFKITSKDKINLFNFITKEDQEVSGRSVTGFQKAITEAVQDPNKMILLAKLLATDFDMSDLEKKAKITETKRIKETLESRKGLRPNASRGSQLTGGKSLADLFD